MISCAAIQKLERYGQLALKRHSVADFLQSSLKDAKRANIYALTHLPTWRSAHAAIAGAPSNNNNNNSSSSPSGDASTAVVTEALLHAISHTTALLSHHIHLSLLMAATKSEKQHNTSPSTTTSSSSSAVDAILQFASDVLPVNHDDADSSSMRPWMRCASLLELLVGILATHVLRRRKTTANSGPVAATFTQAVLHLFSRVADLSMYLIALKAFMQQQQQQQQKSVNDDDEDAVQVERCVELSLSFSAAVTQLLHASLARTSHLTAMFQHRTCGSLLGGLLSRGAARGADSTKRDDVALLDAQDANNNNSNNNISTDSSMEPLLAQLLCCSTQSRSSISGGGGGGNNNNNARAPFCAGTSFDGLTLFQRLTLLHAAWANAQRQLAPHLASRTHVLRQTIDAIISLAVSNKATRFVVYFRGDDVKLLQNDVRSPADYALHTYATTPPIDATLLEQLAAAERATNTRGGGGGAMDDVWCWVGLLLTQWIVSLPCIFDGFCMNPSWAAFAQEQRRKVMVRQAQERRAAADQRRTQRRAGAATTTNRGTSSSSDGSATPEVEPRDDDDDGAMSVASVQTSASRSMRSMESRASLLSTLSKESVSSYISFISRLAPEVQEHEGAMDAPHLHESADGNTNLPLILLEEIILGLHRFEEAMPEKILQRFGLRALMWQTMGQLFAMVQQTMSTTTTSTSSSSAAVPPIFHLGQDIRYNHGLGYESLGMVFAAVVAPQLEREGGRRRGDDDDEDDDAHVVNARSTLLQQHLRDAALSRCLAAYEYIAPQVVDAHLSSILHIFTRSAMKGRWLRRVSSSSSSSPSLDNVDDDGDDDVLLHDFLCGIIARLGKSNQLPLFLSAVAEQRADALIESATTHLHHNNNTSTKEGMTLMMRDVSPVQAVLCLPVVRRALTEAAAASIDPERLLGELLTLVASWGDDDGDDDDEEKKQTKQPHAGRDPRDVLLVLFLIRVVMDGVVPTSITASTLLERSTELEMHLVHTFQRHILGNDDDDDDGDDKTRFFSTNISASMRRRLALHLLQSIYHCRELTHACLQDLGMANVEEYLIMLEDTLWQVQTKVADLVGTARVADLRRVVEQDYVKKDDDDDMYRVAEDVLHHSVEVRTLLPMMMLQRLKLVRAVSVLLNMQDVGPPHDLKELVGELLQSLLISLEQQQQQQQHHHQELVDLANRITEAEWQSIVLLGKPKAVRQALTSLLISSFTTSTNVVDEVRNNNTPPAWLARCLQCVGGAVMHAVSSIFCGISEKEVLQLVGEASTTTATTTAIRNSARSLIAMLDALEHIYAIAGHVPYWPSLLEHCVAWICALGQQLLHDDDGSHQQQHHHDDDAARATRRTVMARLITFAYTCITHEPRSQEVLRRCLLNGSDASATTTTTHAPARKHAQGLRPSFVEAVGVPVALLTDFRTSSPTTCEEEAGATFAPQEWSFEAEVRRACGLMFGTSCSSTNNNNNNICFVEAVLVCAREACSHASPSLSNNITNNNNNNNTLAIATRIVALLYSAAVNATHWSARGAPTTTTKVDRSSATSFLCFVADFIEGHARNLVTDSHNDDDEVQPHKQQQQQQQRISARRRWSPRAFAIVMQNFVAGLKCPIAPSPTPLTQNNNNNNTKKKDVDVAVDDASTTAPLHHVQTMWLTTLAHHLRYAQRVGTLLITHDDARNIMMEEPLSSLHVLYHALLQAFVGRRQQPAKRTRDQQQQQQRGGDASSSCAPRSATALIMAIKDVMSGDDQSSLDEWMQSLCAAPEKRDDGAHLRKRLRGVVALLHASRSTSVNVKKMKFSCSGMVSLWVLHQIHDEWHANNNNNNSAKGRRGDDASGTTPQQHHGSSSSSSWLLEVMGAYQRAISREPSPSSETELLERMTQHMLQASSSSHDASTSSPCQSAAASTYVVEALAAVCAALNALTADAAPSALFSLLHRLLHDSIPSPHTMQRWLYGQSSATTTTTQDVREEAQQMGYLLLLHAAHILQELGNVAGLRSAARKPHMKRLCWAVAQPWVRAMRHQLLQHNNNNSSTSSLASPRAQQLRAVLPATIELHQLWSRVLQLCCSPTLYAEPDFADAVWRFLTTVLAAGAGSTNTNNNSSGENNILITNKNDAETSVDVRSVLLTHEMEAVLRLLNHSWLGGGARHGVEVLWVHPAMVPHLLSGVLVCLLRGMSCDVYHRRLLNTLGALFFHVVRSVDEVGDEDTNTEAEHSRPRPRKSGQHAATHPSSSSSSSRRSGVALRRMALAATTASMFQVSARFVHIFTRFSSDLDDLSSDFLQFLRRQHLPAHSAAATTHEDENTSTLADLVFASVGEEEGRALLREAAARVEEEDGVAGAERLVERRHIFNVEA